jgi:hypothetical protein
MIGGRMARALEKRDKPRSILVLALGLVLTLYLGHAAPDDFPTRRASAQSASQTSRQNTNTMRIRLTINGKSVTASLEDNATSRDFVSLLPMTIKLDDYASTEKISYLTRKLTTAGAPAGVDPSVGDITYYAPWGNLAIFYRDFGYSKGLVKLGSIDSGAEVLDVPGPLTVTIEPLER